MTGTEGILELIFKPLVTGFMALCGIVFGIGASMWRDIKVRVDNHDDVLHKHETENLNFRLDAEKRYAKEETMQTSLGRLHDRIDGIGSDIKTILVRLPK